MQEEYLRDLFAFLRQRGVQVEDGLSDAEIKDIEKTFSFQFPLDLRALLQFGLPISNSFPNWRHKSEPVLQGRLAWPLDGIAFDVEYGAWWPSEWGLKPATLVEALEIARRKVLLAPVLIPIYSHRYIPSEPNEVGNPVFSVYQTDIIFYGYDLPSYFNHEFGAPLPEWARKSPREIRFWSRLEELNNIGFKGQGA